MHIQAILEAKRPEDIFGNDENNIAKTYRLLSKATHPDKNGGSTESNNAFAKLTDLHNLALFKVEKGTFGIAASMATIQSTHKYDILKIISSSPLSDLYLCLVDDQRDGLFFVSKGPKLNSYMDREAKVLSQLLTIDGYTDLLPEFIESFTYSEDGVYRKTNVFYDLEGYVSLEQIREVYTDGLPSRDMAWIFRRLLDVIGCAHSLNIIHGAIIPSNILVGLGDIHEVKLVDWKMSVVVGQPIKVIDPEYKKFYPPEVLRKESSTWSLDLYMASLCMVYLLGPSVDERAIRAFLSSCYLQKVGGRPHNAWGLRKEFTSLVEKLWGPRQYRPLTFPN